MRTYFFKINASITIVGADGNWYIELSRGEGLISRIICKEIISRNTAFNFKDTENEIKVLDYNTKVVSLNSINEDIKELPIMVSESPVNEKVVICKSIEIEDLRIGTYEIFERIVFGESHEDSIGIPEQYVDFLDKIAERASGDDKNFTISQSELDRLAEIYEKTR